MTFARMLVFQFLLVFSCFCLMPAPAFAASKRDGEVHILATTFPIWLLARNIIEGRNGADLGLMIPAAVGCPHDYSLTPQDMRKLSRADIVIANGLGLEEFMGMPLKKANPELVVIEAAGQIKELLEYSGESHASRSSHEHQHGHAHSHDADEAHTHEGINPHVFASPRLYAQMALHIGEQLAMADPQGAATYKQNARRHAEELNRLAEEGASVGLRLENRHIVAQHGVLDYLARDMGLEIVGLIQAHPGQEPSAAEMLELVKKARREKAGAVCIEPQYPRTVGELVGREVDIPVIVVDPVASGPENASLDYYQNTMRHNLSILEQTLGSR